MDYSIVIPIYKRSELLLETLNSVSSQDLQPLEIIIVDNNSTDQTLNIVKNFMQAPDLEDEMKNKYTNLLLMKL